MEDYRLISPVRSADSRNARLQAVGLQRKNRKVLFKLEPDTLKSFLRHEVPIHSEHDPFRPMGYFDSYAKNNTVG